MQFPVTINGEKWRAKFVKALKLRGEYVDGVCEPGKREIHIDAKLTGQQLAEVVIHEVLHAASPALSEKFVTQTAEDVAAALYHPKVRGLM